MSLGLGHFAVGATLTTLVVAVLFPRMPFPRTAALIGGAWALFPDAAKLIPSSPRLIAFHDGPWADLFWFHRTLDQVDPNDSARLSALFIALLIVVTALAEYRSYRAATRVRDTYREPDRSARGD